MNPRDQDQTFCFCIVTATSIQHFFFEWKERNHNLQLRLLNTICGWNFERNWNDDEYKFPTGRIIRATESIKAELKRKSTEIYSMIIIDYTKMAKLQKFNLQRT